jgi:Ca2+-binding EF-hand superfamily protein
MANTKGLKAAFDLFDIDKDGTITQKELKRIMGPILQESSSRLWDEMLEEHDKNGDGVIDIDEFAEMMAKLLGGKV